VIITCWSVKGGSGTSVVTAGLAVAMAEWAPVLLVDLAGDQPAVLGAAGPTGPGVVDWMQSGPGVGGGALEALATDVAPGLRLLHRGAAVEGSNVRWADLAEVLRASSDDVVIDAGLAPLPPPLAAISDESLLVVRPCYLALRRASSSPDAPSGVIVVDEPGRALGHRDVERVIGVRIVASVGADPAVARAVDAGLLRSRLPAALRQLARQVSRSLADVDRRAAAS
jgi:hypothetical protein